MALVCYLIHIVGCLWYAQIYANIFNYQNWVRSLGIEDASMIQRYAASIYWACVTCTTVGYGDITPTNKFELVWSFMVLTFGISLFSMLLSDLSSQFIKVLAQAHGISEKSFRIERLLEKFALCDEVISQILFEIKHGQRLLESETKKNLEIQHLLKILPSTLTHRLGQFIFKGAIKKIPFLQDRELDFYSRYLEELKLKNF